MNFDLAVAAAVLLFAVLGAFSGFSRQVAQTVAALAAFFAAGPAGRFFALPFAQKLSASLTVGVVLATIVSFIVVYLLVRAVLTLVIRRLLAGKNPEDRSKDRVLGAALGGLKAAALVWVGVSAATFLENNLVISGKKFGFTPKDSAVVRLTRQYNVIELQQFSGAKDLAKALKFVNDPKNGPKLKGDPDYAALLRDPRFKALLSQKALQQALETGDVRALVANDKVIELIHDPKQLRHLERLGALDDEPPSAH
jgi:membrane protein required for colicin V production